MPSEAEERLLDAVADAAAAISDEVRALALEERSTWGRTAQYARSRRRLDRSVGGILRGVKSGDLAPEAGAERFAASYERAALDAAASAASRVGVAPDSAVFARVGDEVDRTARAFGEMLGEVARGEIGDDEVARRRGLYVDRLDGFRNKVWADMAGGEGVTWWWEIQPGDNCVDCLVLHLESPYDEQPPTVPGLTGTRCGSNCRCKITMTENRREPGT